MDSGIKTNAKVCWINHWKNATTLTHSFTPYVDLSDKSVSSLVDDEGGMVCEIDKQTI